MISYNNANKATIIGLELCILIMWVGVIMLLPDFIANYNASQKHSTSELAPPVTASPYQTPAAKSVVSVLDLKVTPPDKEQHKTTIDNTRNTTTTKSSLLASMRSYNYRLYSFSYRVKAE